VTADVLAEIGKYADADGVHFEAMVNMVSGTKS